MIFFKLFLIYTVKDQNSAEKLTNLEENLIKVGPRGDGGVCLSKSALYYNSHIIIKH